MLDAVGPLEVLSMLPGAEVKLTAKTAGIVWPDNQAIPFVAPYCLEDVQDTDILLIPGGPGTDCIENDKDILEWIRRIHAKTVWTCSVCTGALILAAAGLLEGKEATTHWSVLPRLSEFNAIPVSKRWAEQDKIITAAGVSAGIDMALFLASRISGERAAEAIQLAIEYDPAPPFNSGTIESAGADIASAVLDGTIEFDRRKRPRPIILNVS